MARVGQHQRNHLFGDGVGVGARRVHHIHVPRTGMLDVDRVVSRPGANDHLERRQGVDDGRRDLFRTDDHGVGIRMLGSKGCKIRRIVLDDFILPMLAERLASNAIELGRNQYFFHRFLSVGVEKHVGTLSRAPAGIKL